MIRTMQCSLPEGGYVLLQWPDNINVESVDEAREIIALQLDQIRRRAAAAGVALRDQNDENPHVMSALNDCGEAGHGEGRCGNAQCLRGVSAVDSEGVSHQTPMTDKGAQP